MACYLKTKHLYKKCVLYEEIIANVVEKTNTLFEALNIPLEFVPEALKALDTHSQKNMFDKKITEDWNEELLWNEVDEIFNELDIPIKISMSEPMVIFSGSQNHLYPS